MKRLKVFKNSRKFQRINSDNINDLKRVISQSGIGWHELYYVNENRYYTCFQIMEFPEGSHYNFLKRLNDNRNTFCTVDFRHVDASEFEARGDSEFNRANRNKDDARTRSSFRKAAKSGNEYEAFTGYIDASKNTVKLITLRVFVFGSTLEDLQDKSEKVTNEFSRMKVRGYIQTNNLREDYQSLTMYSNPVAQDVSSATLADMTLSSNINIVDYHAGLIGVTATGVYAPNHFSFNNSSYNVVYVGGMGSGKSALAKKIEKTMLIKGNHTVLIFDIHNEYDEYCQMLNIERVSFSEEQCVNIMQIFHVDNMSQDAVIRENDIQTRISSIQETFVSFTGIERQQTKIQLGKILREVYESFIARVFTEVPADSWPVLGDVLDAVNQKVKMMSETESDITTSEHSIDLYNLQIGLSEMCNSYGYIFNRKTNIDFDLTKSLCFDISFLSDNRDYRVISSYMSVLSNYASYGAYLNLKKNEEMEIKLNSKLDSTTHYEPYFTYRVLIDEFIKYAKSLSFLTDMDNLIKFMRKAFSGLGFIVHTTQETQSDLTTHGAALKNIFDLCSTKYIGKTEHVSAKSLPELLSTVTKYDADSVARFQKGKKGERQFLVHDDQGRKVYFTSIITERERSYFKGGV